MAKIAFTKLGLSKNQDVKTFEWNGQVVEVKQYLPISDKLQLIGNVIISAADTNYANPVKLDAYLVLEVIFNYTNINFTEKQKEDLDKLYDLFCGTGFWAQVKDFMDDEEWGFLYLMTHKWSQKIYEYNNSVYGILDNVAEDYKNLDLNASAIQEKLSDPDNLALVRQVLSKLG